jgi:hypothetical protein
MGKTLVRASHRKYKKNAKGYTKRKIIIKKSRHTRNRRGGDENDFKSIKEEIKKLLQESSRTYDYDDFSRDVATSNYVNSKYFKNFEKMYKLWSELTDDEKKKFEDFFLNVGWGHAKRRKLYESVLSDFKVHDGCKNTVRGNKSEMQKCLVQKFGVRPGNTGFLSNLLPYYSDLDTKFVDEWKKTNTLQLRHDTGSAARQTVTHSINSDGSFEPHDGGSKRRPKSSRRVKFSKSKKGRSTRHLMRKHRK